MTEPLGRSQVLEYLGSLSHSNTIFLISFERKGSILNGHTKEIQELVNGFDIQWHFIEYSNRFGIASTAMQIMKASWFATDWIKNYQIEIVHARSFIPATIGLTLKAICGVKLLFDIRGFSIEEKVDRGRLKKDSLLFRVLRRMEKYLYRSADHIVTLTYAAKEILTQDADVASTKITVIPTCASRDVFRVMSQSDKRSFKSSLQYDSEARIVIHTGTVSGWYDFESEVKLVGEMMKLDNRINFLVLNRNDQPFIKNLISQYTLPSDRVKLKSVPFNEVYKYLNIASFSLFFIKPSYSKKASLPTKFAENVACLLPSVTNTGIGDMDFYLQKYGVGHTIDLSELDADINKIAGEILKNVFDIGYICSEFSTLFDRHLGNDTSVSKYQSIYDSLKKI